MEKINIAIIDSNQLQRETTIHLIEEYLRKTNILAFIEGFNSGSELMQEVLTNGQYDVYIMEVAMPEMNGISLAKELRTVGDKGIIIYLSYGTEDAYNAIQVRATDYILRPLNLDKIKRGVENVKLEIWRTNKSPLVEIKYKDGIMRVPADSITYVDIVDRALCFHLESGKCLLTKCVRGSFKGEIERSMLCAEDLSNFIYAGKSHFLNLAYILGTYQDEIQLINGERVLLSKKCQKMVLKAWRGYCWK